MPIISGPLKPNDTGQAVADLHQLLLNIGAPIADAERNGKRFGDSTLAAVLAVRSQHGLPPASGTAPPFDASVSRLLHAASPAVAGNRPALRIAVRESIAAAGAGSPEENYWLARYALIAGNYTLAQRAAARAPLLSGLVSQIVEISRDPAMQPPRPPEVPYPENFYAYRYTLVDQATLDELLGRIAADSRDASPRMTLRRIDNLNGMDHWPEPPEEQGPELPPGTQPNPARQEALRIAADSWLKAVDNWQVGNEEIKRRSFANAVSAYTECQRFALGYFTKFYADVDFLDIPHIPFRGRLSLEERINRWVRALVLKEARWSAMWEAIRQRRLMLSLQELGDHDWGAVTQRAVELLRKTLQGEEDANEPEVKALRQRSLDRPLVILATVMAPLARAEANRLRRQYDAAERDFRRVLSPYTIQDEETPSKTRVRFTCDFIEDPFIRLLLAATLLEKADAQYKARTPVADGDRSILATAAAEYRNRLGDPANRNEAAPFQSQQAARTYLSVVELFTDEAAYEGACVSRVDQGVEVLVAKVHERLTQGDFSSSSFHALGKDVTIPTIRPVGNSLPGMAKGIGPHEPLLKFHLPAGQPVVRETNPRVYAILLEAQARIAQLWFWFNYLGYSDEYVPPWRFQFLLERARYFAEHAKNAQREYLNFLSNAEREEFQELTAAQNVEMEKSNVRIESARVDQAALQVAASGESARLAELAASNAHDRLERYAAFDEYADRLMDVEGANLMVSAANALDKYVPHASSVLENVPLVGGFFSTPKRKLLEAVQREVEKYNLELAEEEARQAASVAAAQLATAQAGLVVAALQRQTALLRHEFAVQNLEFLRNRILNAELWYRLSAAIRAVADTYLRYGVEMGFLAEQAHEFEADKRVDVIRFDYDASELGDMLAGDFLLRDLDTLEQDLIVGQKIRQQQVRYLLSLSREFPEALQELRDNGTVTFSTRLEQLERRFPGLFNLRISSVELLPVALLDATRFSMELTHLGSGYVRLNAQTTVPGELLGKDWLSGLEADWAIRLRTTLPETAVFSGLTRQDVAGSATLFTTNQRGAFEGLVGASAWKVDFSMKENRIVPNSLADVLITFTLSGYYDATLREAIDHAPRPATAIATWFSAHQNFPDQFYQFNRSGRMEWRVTPDFLALRGSIGELRNVAILCIPSQKRPQLGRQICSYPVELELDASGNIQILRELPLFSLSTNGLALDANISTPAGTVVSLDFGDASGFAESSALPHTYARPGRYDVTIRIAAGGRLTEYSAAVVVSRLHSVPPPLIAVPIFQTSVADGKISLQPSLQTAAGESLSVSWNVDNKQPDAGSNPVTFSLDPGRYVLRFIASRPLTARFYSQQRYAPTTAVALNGLRLATNRTFDVNTGTETTTNLNAFGQHLFEQGPLAPTDRWTLELPLGDNPSAVSVSSSDVKQYDLGELSDAMLALEYVVRDE